MLPQAKIQGQARMNVCLEMGHEFDDYFVLFRGLRNCAIAVEVLFIIDADVRKKRFGEADGHSSCHPAALVVVDDKGSCGVR